IDTDWGRAGTATRCDRTRPVSSIGAVGATESAVAHTGQRCEGALARSVQKWICAAGKTSTRSIAKIATLRQEGRMYLVRRSLGKKSCRVKQRDSHPVSS